MKHKAVESMVRIQYDIPDDVEVKVKFEMSVLELEEFTVEWWIGDNMNFVVLHISTQYNEKRF